LKYILQTLLLFPKMKKALFFLFFLYANVLFAQYTLTRALPLNLISGSGTAITLGDDNFSASLPIGFNFQFFGNSHTSFFIGSNGFLSFGAGYSSTSATIPSASNPNNIIAFATTDQNCSVGTPTINYFTSGISPNRILVVNYINVEEFGNSLNLTTVQIQLFEGSNKVELHSTLNASNGSTRTIGLENANGTIGSTIIDLNNSLNVIANNELIRFTPCTSPNIGITASNTTYCNTPITLTVTNCNGSVSWNDGSTTSTIYVSPLSNNTTYSVNCNENGCIGSASKIINRAFPFGAPFIIGNNLICNNGTSILKTNSTSSADTLQWFKNNQVLVGQNNSNFLANSPGDYYVQNKNGACTINSNSVNIILTTNKSSSPVLKSPPGEYTCKDKFIELEVSGTGTLNKFVNGNIYFNSNVTGADYPVYVDQDSDIYATRTEPNKCDSDTSNHYKVKVVTAQINILPDACGNKLEINTVPANVPISSYQWYNSTGNTILGVTGKTFITNQSFSSANVFLENGCSIGVGPAFGSSTNQLPYIYAFRNDSLGNVFKTRKKIIFSTIQVIKKSIKLQNGDDLKVGTFGSSSNNYYLERKNTEGVNLWTKTIYASTSSSTTCTDVLENNDGSIIIAGSSNSGIGNSKTETTFGGFDYWILKLSSTGTILWNKTIGGGGSDRVNSISLSSDGNILIAGTSNSSISGNKTQGPNFVDSFWGNSIDIWLVKVSQNGTIMFDKVIGAGNVTYQKEISKVKITQNPDNSYLIASNTNYDAGTYKSSNSFGLNDIWVLKTTDTFIKTWDYTYGGDDIEEFIDLLNLANGEIVILGNSQSGNMGNKTSLNYGQNDIWILKLNSSGQKLWDKSFGGTNYDNSISIHKINNSYSFYIISNSSSQSSSTKTARNRYNANDLVWILQVNQNGDLINDTQIEDLNNSNLPQYPYASTIDSQNELHIFCSYTSHYGKFIKLINDNTVIPLNSNNKFAVVNCNTPLWSNGLTTSEITPSNSGTYTAKCGNCISNPMIFGSGCSSFLNLVNPTDNYNNLIIVKSASSLIGSINASNLISGANAKVLYTAKSIELKPGFLAENNSVFEAKVGGCN
jgi:hypothetical protein